MTNCAAMINLIGRAPPTESILSVPEAHLHLYGKEPRPGRKLGHVTLCASTPAALQQRLQQLHALLKDDLEEEG
jgi:5-(carboxyamino)imidazole ribonucleotide synthase